MAGNLPPPHLNDPPIKKKNFLFCFVASLKTLDIFLSPVWDTKAIILLLAGE